MNKPALGQAGASDAELSEGGLRQHRHVSSAKRLGSAEGIDQRNDVRKLSPRRDWAGYKICEADKCYLL